jgi:hypothetical protein
LAGLLAEQILGKNKIDGSLRIGAQCRKRIEISLGGDGLVSSKAFELVDPHEIENLLGLGASCLRPPSLRVWA